MRKQLILTYTLLSALGLSTSVQALNWDDAKDLFDQPVSTTDEPISDLDGQNGGANKAPGDDSEKKRGESEPNNSAESADPLASGIEYIGQMFGPDDQDWFRIDTTQNNEIITIQTAVANDLWLFTVRDRAGNILASATNNDSDGVVIADGVNDDLADKFKMSITAEKAGTYYIIVSPAPDLYGLQGDNTFQDFSSQNYHLRVTLSDPTNPDNPVVDSNFFDLETEPNNHYLRTDSLASGKLTMGQLSYLGDEDWYEINSPGNEVIDINFCGPITVCSGQSSRIVMVLQKEFITDEVHNALINGVPITEGGIVFNRLHTSIEFLEERGHLDDALLAKLHPDFGGNSHLKLGIDRPGTYYIVVAGKLRRKEGRIDTNVTITEVPILVDGQPLIDQATGIPATRLVANQEAFFFFENFSDDQYAIQITRTSFTPHTPGTNEFDAERDRAKFDSSTGIIHIPELEFNGAVFEAELIHRDDDERNLYELLQLREIEQ